MQTSQFTKFLETSPDLSNLELTSEDMSLVQVYIEDIKEETDLITEEATTRVPFNYFKVLKGKYEGKIVSIRDIEMSAPILGMSPAKGNRHDEPSRPIFGNPLDKLIQFSYNIDKRYLEFGYYLIPNSFITTVYKNPLKLIENEVA